MASKCKRCEGWGFVRDPEGWLGWAWRNGSGVICDCSTGKAHPKAKGERMAEQRG